MDSTGLHFTQDLEHKSMVCQLFYHKLASSKILQYLGSLMGNQENKHSMQHYGIQEHILDTKLVPISHIPKNFHDCTCLHPIVHIRHLSRMKMVLGNQHQCQSIQMDMIPSKLGQLHSNRLHN